MCTIPPIVIRYQPLMKATTRATQLGRKQTKRRTQSFLKRYCFVQAVLMLRLRLITQKVNWEHHGVLVIHGLTYTLLTGTGPASWMSICSQPGVRWVSECIGNEEFARSARSLTLGWSRRLKLMAGWNRFQEPEPEPTEEIAWKYCAGESTYLVSTKQDSLTCCLASPF